MKRTNTFLVITVFAATVAFGCGQTGDNEAVAPDNTAVNERNQNAGELTADQQDESEADRELTAAIRSAVMADESLSTYAHNVKIISQDGEVTLKGPVQSEEERKSILDIATAASDESRVIDEMSIAP